MSLPPGTQTRSCGAGASLPALCAISREPGQLWNPTSNFEVQTSNSDSEVSTSRSRDRRRAMFEPEVRNSKFEKSFNNKKGVRPFPAAPRKIIVRRSLYPINGLSYSFSRKM
jgi:hypothetical protein